MTCLADACETVEIIVCEFLNGLKGLFLLARLRILAPIVTVDLSLVALLVLDDRYTLPLSPLLLCSLEIVNDLTGGSPLASSRRLFVAGRRQQWRCAIRAALVVRVW